MSIIISAALLYFLSFLLIWQFVGYPLLMAIVALRSKPKNKDYSFQPFVSILVPTYNEEKVIDNRIKNLYELNYPKERYEVIVVDSGSSDNTVGIVKEVIRECKGECKPYLRIVEEGERKGKASAINLGKKHARGEIVLVTDANSIFDRNVLREMMPHFKNPKVGAVGGDFVVSNPDPDNSLTSSAHFYWDIDRILRKGEAILDSMYAFDGEMNAWRKDLIDADPTMLAEDLEMSVRIRRKGYKIEHESNAMVYEPVSTTVEDQIKQRRRTSIGAIQTIFKHSGYLLLPKDLYSFLIFPSHKTLVMFSPFFLLAIPILYAITWNAKIAITHFVSTLLFFVVIFALLIFLKSKLIKIKGRKSSFSISTIPGIVYYVLLNEYLILLAWKDFIFRRYSVLWEKTESTRVTYGGK